jgi:hypothetical protein
MGIEAEQFVCSLTKQIQSKGHSKCMVGLNELKNIFELLISVCVILCS